MGHCDPSRAIVQTPKPKTQAMKRKLEQNQETNKPPDAGKTTEPNIAFGIKLQTSGGNKCSNSGDSELFQ